MSTLPVSVLLGSWLSCSIAIVGWPRIPFPHLGSRRSYGTLSSLQHPLGARVFLVSFATHAHMALSTLNVRLSSPIEPVFFVAPSFLFRVPLFHFLPPHQPLPMVSVRRSGKGYRTQLSPLQGGSVTTRLVCRQTSSWEFLLMHLTLLWMRKKPSVGCNLGIVGMSITSTVFAPSVLQR